MSKKKQTEAEEVKEEKTGEASEETIKEEEKKAPETAEEPAGEKSEEKKSEEKKPEEAKPKTDELAAEKDKYLRLCAEYDNFRKRSQKEKDAIYADVRANTLTSFLPVYDNLVRALNQPTEDEAYKKGVEMTLNGLREVMKNLGVEEFGEAGELFDPNRHNAVMHVERDDLGESVIAQVFQKGFAVGDRVIRFAMVQVAN